MTNDDVNRCCSDKLKDNQHLSVYLGKLSVPLSLTADGTS